jgi:hypothetical protein
LIKGFGGMMQLFSFILKFYITYIHSITCIQSIHPSLFAEAPLHLFIAGQGQWEKPSWGAEPRIDLEPALQQANALPTELRCTLLINAEAPLHLFIAGQLNGKMGC